MSCHRPADSKKHTVVKDHYQASPLSGNGRDWHTLHPFWGWRRTGRRQWPSAHGGCGGRAISKGGSRWRGADLCDGTPGDARPVTWGGWERGESAQVPTEGSTLKEVFSFWIGSLSWGKIQIKTNGSKTRKATDQWSSGRWFMFYGLTFLMGLTRDSKQSDLWSSDLAQTKQVNLSCSCKSSW